MRKELEKYGIQMPAFSKIGGILANELSVDEAACMYGVLKGLDSWGSSKHLFRKSNKLADEGNLP